MPDELTEVASEIIDARESLQRALGSLARLMDTGRQDMGLGNFSQRDPRWRNDEFAGGLRFETDGCYVCAVANILWYAGYSDEPPVVAKALRDAGCFSGAMLSRPHLIPTAYPGVQYNGPMDVSRDGPLRWHDGDADMERVFAELEKGPVIAEIDFQWRTQTFNQHFVVLVEPTDDKRDIWINDPRDIWINDPWDGSVVRLLQKYAGEYWKLERAVYGLRLLQPRM